MDKTIFTKKLIQHKKLIASIFKTKNKNMIIPASKTGEELALAFAECKCEKCRTESNLQYHHLIQRPTKNFMDLWKYITQRFYWANILILCLKCHAEIENRKPTGTGTISQEVMDKIKKKYKIEMKMKEKYFLKCDWEKDWNEVTKEQFIEAERAAGFRPKSGDGIATGGFGGRGVSGRIDSTDDFDDQSVSYRTVTKEME